MWTKLRNAAEFSIIVLCYFAAVLMLSGLLLQNTINVASGFGAAFIAILIWLRLRGTRKAWELSQGGESFEHEDWFEHMDAALQETLSGNSPSRLYLRFKLSTMRFNPKEH